MNKTGLLLGFAALILTTRCESQSQMLAQSQPAALQTAVTRGQFDLSCPQATGEVLSSDYIQPAIQGAWAGREGVTRLEYTVGVQGCGKKDVYIVMCQYGTTTCFAAQSHGPAQ